MIPEKEKPARSLLDQQQALTIYLEALFREMPVLPSDNPDETPEFYTCDVPEPAPFESSIPPRPEPAVAPLTSKSPPSLLAGKIISDNLTQQSSRHANTDRATEPAVPAVMQVAPRVAEQIQRITAPFQALFFNIGGLNLAVPLEKLDGILNWTKVTRLPHLPPWHLGMIKHQGVTVNIVDTRMLVIPPNRLGSGDSVLDYRYVILINDRKWGLSCQSVDKVVTLAPEQVKWNKSTTGARPWLAGTVIEQMCALLDIDAFITLLDPKSSV